METHEIVTNSIASNVLQLGIKDFNIHWSEDNNKQLHFLLELFDQEALISLFTMLAFSETKMRFINVVPGQSFEVVLPMTLNDGKQSAYMLHVMLKEEEIVYEDETTPVN